MRHAAVAIGLMATACAPPEATVRAAAAESQPRTWVAASIGQEFVRLEAGSFLMGSAPAEPGREAQEVQHEVVFTRPFLLATTEVTQQQWSSVTGTNPSEFGDCPTCPVETVSALAIRDFLRRLNAAEFPPGTASPGEPPLRLPTEAEWEYACRAGAGARFGVTGELSTAAANYDGRYTLPGIALGQYRARTTPVGSFPPNAWGLFDMSGNVWEWTADRHCEYSPGRVVDPIGTCDSEFLVIRGGSWVFGADSARCALRYTHRPQDDGPSLGFRLARDVPQEEDR